MADYYQTLAEDTSRAAEWRRWAIIGTCTWVCLLYAMTVSVANVALPQMQGAFSATQDQVSWVVTMNIVATAVVTPMAGWLVTRFGERRLILFSVLGFALSSLACGLAQSLDELVFYRVLQGGFGAPLVPITQTIVQSSFPRHRHGPAIAVWGMGVVLGPVIGPTVGGYLSELYNWRWVFFMMVPFAVIAFGSAWLVFRNREHADRAGLDWVGLIALSVAIACFQLGLDRGERADWFESSEIIIYAVVATLALYVFLGHVLTTERPFLRPVLFRDRNFTVGMVLTLLFGMLNFTPMTLIPPLLNVVGGYPDTIIGYVLGMRGLGTALAFMSMIYLSRYDPRLLLLVGFSCQAIAGWQMAHMGVDVVLWDISGPLFLQGFGVGMLWVPLTLVTFATLKPEYLAEGSSIFHFFRNMGSSIHISLSIAVVMRMKQSSYSEMTSRVTPFNESFSLPWSAGAWDIETTKGIAAISKEMGRQAIMIGYIDSFYFFVGTAVLAIPLILLVRWAKQVH